MSETIEPMTWKDGTAPATRHPPPATRPAAA
jgi:hypothetical protein